MNTKSLMLTLMLCTVLIGLACVRLTTQASTGDSSATTQTAADETVELVWTFEVRIRLPVLKKDAI